MGSVFGEKPLLITSQQDEALEQELPSHKETKKRQEGSWTVILLLLLWLPVTLFWYILVFIKVENPHAFPGRDGQNHKFMESWVRQPWLTDLLEQPTSIPSLAGYGVSLFSMIMALIMYRNRPLQLKEHAFWLHFTITLIIRCLSSFSGLSSTSTFSSLIWRAGSVGKGVWLWLLVESGFWSWTYLGFYRDYHFDESLRTIFDDVGTPVHVFSSDLVKNTLLQRWSSPYSSTSKPWTDTAVRLSYIYLIDNVVHVISLCYFAANAPYTTYINNSEILTVLPESALRYTHMHTCART